MLALTFDQEKDYDRINEDDTFNFIDLESFSPNNQLSLEIIHSDNSKEIIKLNHTFNSQQIDWYKNGSALNLIKSNNL
jgi:aconitate hydratase